MKTKLKKVINCPAQTWDEINQEITATIKIWQEQKMLEYKQLPWYRRLLKGAPRFYIVTYPSKGNRVYYSKSLHTSEGCYQIELFSTHRLWWKRIDEESIPKIRFIAWRIVN